MLKKLFIATVLFLPTSLSFAAAGDQTLTIGYTHLKSDGVKNTVNGMNNTIGGYAESLSDFYDQTSASTASSSDPSGMFVNYRYEFDDKFGIIGSFSYATKDYDAKAGAKGPYYNKELRGKVSADYASITAGPTFRFNEYVSVYGMIGGAYKKINYSVTESSYYGKSKYSDNDSKFEAAFGAGAQFNINGGATLDLSYLHSGSGDWKTDAFSIGIGYKF
ncbi:Ail/Lom family outer membrane beta-barrel protein [Morganella morganii]|uniref:Attachment invasion locus protein n=1 Tax=Morganella morganii TaxID=582 RepID=A0AAU8ZGW2_MORMO|nr:Ail/Lom family outer membrane beta-barrel protein [Morganella morganii]AWC92315.1 hypothetical protein AM380_00905 [Morganella morganii]HAT3625787.1 Ail/Lom family outer membrane beta-barrel protein [Morganella morganii]HAT3766127.1 Ail/Lom family outer membrane beta-barrel protein [Morganella morganii]